MPDEREQRRLRAGAGEHFTVALGVGELPPGQLHEVARTRRGAAAYGVRLASRQPIDPPAGPGDGYLVVLDGTVVLGDAALPGGSLAGFDRLDELHGLTGAGDGAFLAVVAFPTSGSAAPGPAPSA